MQNLKEDTLLELGLSKNEAKVYLALLRLGTTTAGKISDISGIHRTNVYDALDRLIERGLVSFIVKNDSKFYEAEHPNNLINILKRKEEKLMSVIPQLILDKNLSGPKPEARILTGVKAYKNILEGYLEKNMSRVVYGLPRKAYKMLGPFLVHYHKRRIEKKLEIKHIYNFDARKRINFLNKMPYTEARYLPKEFDSPVSTSICGDEVNFVLYEKEPIIIQICNQKIADAYRRYFDILWEMAKKD